MSAYAIGQVGFFIWALGWVSRYLVRWPKRLDERLAAGRRLLLLGLFVTFAVSSPNLLPCAPVGVLALTVCAWGLSQTPLKDRPLLPTWVFPLLAVAWLLRTLDQFVPATQPVAGYLSALPLALAGVFLCLALSRIYRAADRDILARLAKLLPWVWIPTDAFFMFNPDLAAWNPDTAGLPETFASAAKAGYRMLVAGPGLLLFFLVLRMRRAEEIWEVHHRCAQEDVPALEQEPIQRLPDETAEPWSRPSGTPPTMAWTLGMFVVTAGIAAYVA